MAFSFSRFLQGLNLGPKSVSTVSQMGDMDVTSGDGKLNYFNGSSASPIVTEAQTATLTNKTMDGNDNTFTNIPGSALPANTATTNTVQTFTNKTINAPDNTITNILNSNIGTAAAIAYTKLNLSNSIVNADVNTSAAIQYSKLNLTGNIVNADVNSSASIAYTKLNLFDSVVDTDINSAAAINRTKIANGSANHVVINSGTGALSSEATLAKSRGGTGADNSSVTFPSTGTITTNAGVQTLTNKTIVGSANSISGISNLMLTSGSASNNQVLTADGIGGTSWQTPSGGSGSGAAKNFLLNSNFDLWQRGTTANVTNVVQLGYLADRWFVKNTLGTNSIITCSQANGPSQGIANSNFVSQIQIATAPTAAFNSSGCEYFQTIDNSNSLLLYNQTASFGIQVKALNNVTQVGIQFMYATNESKATTNAIGSEVLTTVNSSTFTQCSINGQALGIGMTSSGVIGVRIRPTAVSSGNVYDATNGMVVGQAMVNLGSTVASYNRAGTTFGEELSLCQRYYEKSYDVTVVPATSTYAGAINILYPATTIPTSGIIAVLNFKQEKRISTASVDTWSIIGTNRTISNYRTSSNITATVGNIGSAADGAASFHTINSVGSPVTGLTTTDGIGFHYVADAEI